MPTDLFPTYTSQVYESYLSTRLGESSDFSYPSAPTSSSPPNPSEEHDDDSSSLSRDSRVSSY